MLTADLVQVRRHGGELRLVRLDARRRARALEIAEQTLCCAREGVSLSRDEVQSAWEGIEHAPHERKLLLGLRKLIDDACVWEEPSAFDPVELRREVFHRATTARRTVSPEAGFERDVVLGEVAKEKGISVAVLEEALYADLRAAQRLVSAPKTTSVELVDRLPVAQVQAVLLRAVRIVVDVSCGRAGVIRALFRKLKFLRLLHTIEPTASGHRIVVDGPFSLFSSVTKYGLSLALLVPSLLECDDFRLEAEVRWGRDRDSLRFQTERASLSALRAHGEDVPDRLPDEVEALVRAFRALDLPWVVAPATAILDLPGVGLCVPDLVFTHTPSGERVLLEVLGFWSRQAVWRRVALAQAGLPERVLFAVSARLRVSEEVLDPEVPAALYVYKGVMSARVIAERLAVLVAKPTRDALHPAACDSASTSARPAASSRTATGGTSPSSAS